MYGLLFLFWEQRDTGEVCLCPPEAGGSEQDRSVFASLFHSCTVRNADGSQLASSLSAPWLLALSLPAQMSDSGPVAVLLGPGDSAPGSWLQGD